MGFSTRNQAEGNMVFGSVEYIKEEGNANLNSEGISDARRGSSYAPKKSSLMMLIAIRSQ